MSDETNGRDALSDSDLEDREAEYQKRNEPLQHVIDILAEYEESEIEEHGTKAQIARENDIEQHRIHYVLNRWNDLVRYRRFANRDPLDPAAVKAGYEDETMRAMAGQSEAVADGASAIRVDVELTLDEVFRAIKLLPGDLGLKVYGQTLESDFDRGVVRRMLEGDE